MADGTFIEKAKDFIRANPRTTIEEVAGALGISVKPVKRARQQLIAAGEIQPYHRTKPPAATAFDRDTMLVQPPPPDDGKGAMSAEELHEILSRKMRLAGKTDEINSLSNTLIKLLPKPETEDDKLGPGAPLTDEDRIERAGLILRALGADMSMQAIEWARKPSTIPAEGMGQKEPSADNAEAV